MNQMLRGCVCHSTTSELMSTMKITWGSWSLHHHAEALWIRQHLRKAIWFPAGPDKAEWPPKGYKNILSHKLDIDIEHSKQLCPRELHPCLPETIWQAPSSTLFNRFNFFHTQFTWSFRPIGHITVRNFYFISQFFSVNSKFQKHRKPKEQLPQSR